MTYLLIVAVMNSMKIFQNTGWNSLLDIAVSWRTSFFPFEMPLASFFFTESTKRASCGERTIQKRRPLMVAKLWRVSFSFDEIGMSETLKSMEDSFYQFYIHFWALFNNHCNLRDVHENEDLMNSFCVFSRISKQLKRPHMQISSGKRKTKKRTTAVLMNETINYINALEKTNGGSEWVVGRGTSALD